MLVAIKHIPQHFWCASFCCVNFSCFVVIISMMAKTNVWAVSGEKGTSFWLPFVSWIVAVLGSANKRCVHTRS